MSSDKSHVHITVFVLESRVADLLPYRSPSDRPKTHYYHGPSVAKSPSIAKL
jgi:hypothetical protein